MTKHKKCTKCKGNCRILKEVYDPHYMRMRTVEEECPRCNGTGFEKKDDDDLEGEIKYWGN